MKHNYDYKTKNKFEICWPGLYIRPLLGGDESEEEH